MYIFIIIVSAETSREWYAKSYCQTDSKSAKWFQDVEDLISDLPAEVNFWACVGSVC